MSESHSHGMKQKVSAPYVLLRVIRRLLILHFPLSSYPAYLFTTVPLNPASVKFYSVSRPHRALRHHLHDIRRPEQRDRAEGGVPRRPGERGGAHERGLEEILLWGHQTDIWLRGAALLKTDASPTPLRPPRPAFVSVFSTSNISVCLARDRLLPRPPPPPL